LPTLSVGNVAEVDLRMGLQEKEGGCSRHREWQMRNRESLWEKWPKWGIEAAVVGRRMMSFRQQMEE